MIKGDRQCCILDLLNGGGGHNWHLQIAHAIFFFFTVPTINIETTPSLFVNVFRN